MNKSVFLYVYGGDFSAQDFEQKFNPDEFYEAMLIEDVKYKVIEDDESYIEVKIKEYDGDISDEAIEFIKNLLCDDDDLKHSNLYKVN
ncbi:hypothetical protein [Paenibacillus naphthalenovorans]|uniref:Uncharacterized protein n=1 Tax=Paenibacillus naphthalenovorans TaxID=162209 RepID=A0A0U2W9V9_9BACL|nr:hypothetical protein [Paenibacillus naphthalenovorans]ALS22154.1 hypothetical protein IJ22_17800 [Paenibacillus naphthalenovorans]